MSTQTLTREQAIRAILRLEALDAGILKGRCTQRCSVTVDPVVDERTTIYHNGEAFPVSTDAEWFVLYQERQRRLIAPYARWAQQFHPAPDASMT